MFKLPNGANGKALTTTPETFFQQFAPVPNPLDPRQITLVPLPGTGIPIRDYFAAKIINGFAWADYDNGTDDFERMSRDAYRLADAMISARKQGGEQTSQFHEDYMK